MTTIEQRLQAIEDRQALQDLLSTYLTALDKMSDLDLLLDCFTEDGVFDMTDLGYPRFEGKALLREFFIGVFAAMDNSAHYAANFKVNSLEQNLASAQTHAIGIGLPVDGDRVEFYVQYLLDFERVDSIWKIKSLRGQPLIPS